MATVITPRSESVLHYLNPIAMVRNLWQHRDLIRQFTKREIEGRYRGSFLGIFWSFINPLILLLIYTFVFGVVFQSRWPNSTVDNLGNFALIIFCGLLIFNLFSESVNRSASLIIGVPNYVKKVVFPLEVLMISALGSSLFHAGISLCIILVANVIISHALPWTVLLLPIVVLPLALVCLGIGWFLASLGVFIRDISYTVGLVVQVLIFTAPIFYPFENVPEAWKPIVQANPLTAVVIDTRNILLWGITPDWLSLGIRTIVSVIILILGYAWFMKTKKAFADVI